MRLVVVGASLAGLRAVEAARRAGHDGPVVLVGAEEVAPYDRPALSKQLLAPGAPAVVAPVRTEASLRDDLGVTLLLGAPATGLDCGARTVHVGGAEVPYDALVVATGASPRPFPGTDRLTGVHHLRTAADGLAVRAALDAGACTVVVGAGFVGCEVASAARARGLPVTVIDAAAVPLVRSLGAQVGQVCVDLHEQAGVDLRLGVGVAGLRGEGGDGGRVTGIRLEDGTHLPADLVVLGTGVAPCTGWLEGSGVALHPVDRGVLCDATLRSTVGGVWAAGDVAHAPNPLFEGRLMRPEHWTTAAEQGAAAARHALDPESAVALAPVPYFWSDQHGHRLQLVGSADADEVVLVGPPGPGLVALYRRGDAVVGVFTLDRPREVMRLRRFVAARSGVDEALAAARALTPVPA